MLVQLLIQSIYPDAQIYINLKGTSIEPLSAAEAMAYLISAWNAEVKISINGDELQGIYQSILHEKKALLLFDDAVDKKQVFHLIPPKTCLMLVVSRNHFSLPGCFNRDLDKLELRDACDLWMGIAKGLNSAEAEKLAKTCGYMPLALRAAAGSLVESPNMTLDQFTKNLKDSNSRLGLIEGVFDVSYDLMQPDMQRHWRLLGVFPGTFNDAGAAAVWETSEDEARIILSSIIKRSMAEWDDKALRYILYDLARDFAQTKLDEKEFKSVSFRHAVYYANVLGEAEDNLLHGGENYLVGFRIFDMDRHNIEHGWKWSKERWEESDDIARLCLDYTLRCVYILRARLNPRECLDWMNTARRSARKLKNMVDEGAALGNMGNAYYSLFEYDLAIELYTQHLEIAREIGNKDGENAALENLGLAYSTLGEYKLSIELFEQCIEIANDGNDKKSMCIRYILRYSLHQSLFLGEKHAHVT